MKHKHRYKIQHPGRSSYIGFECPCSHSLLLPKDFIAGLVTGILNPWRKNAAA